MAVNTGYSPEGKSLKAEHLEKQRDLLVLSGRFNQMNISIDSQHLDEDDKKKIEEWDYQELEKERMRRKEEMRARREEAELKLKKEEAEKKIRIWQEKQKEKSKKKEQIEKERKEEMLRLGKKKFLQARMEYEAALYFDDARFSLRNDARHRRDLYESEEDEGKLDDSKMDFAEPDSIENVGSVATRVWNCPPVEFEHGSPQQVEPLRMEVLRPRLNGGGNRMSHLPVIPEPSRPQQGEARQVQPHVPRPTISCLANGNYQEFL